MKNTVIVLFGIFFVGCSEAATLHREFDYTNVTTYAVGKECESPGILCDCDTPDVVYICVRIGNDFYKQMIDKCQDGFTCNDKEGGCSDKINYACEVMPDFKMDCTSIGMFPDPYNCKGYHVCVDENDNSGDNSEDTIDTYAKAKTTTPAAVTTPKAEKTTPSDEETTTKPPKPKPPKFKAYDYKCEDGYGYNPATTFCDVPLKDNLCDAPLIPVCRNASRFPQPITANPSLYYLCVFDTDNEGKYMPKIFKCEHGEHLVDGECFNAVDKVDCSAKKDVPDDANCLYYYDCSKGTAEHRQCPPGRSFHKTKRSCVQGYTSC